MAAAFAPQEQEVVLRLVGWHVPDALPFARFFARRLQPEPARKSFESHPVQTPGGSRCPGPFAPACSRFAPRYGARWRDRWRPLAVAAVLHGNAKSQSVLRFRRDAGSYARFAHTHYTSGVRIQRRRYCQMLRPRGQLPKFANSLRRHSDAWAYFDLHPIWQTTQSYVECGDVFGLVSHEGSPHCPAPDCRQSLTAYNHFHRGRRARQNLQFRTLPPAGN